MDNIGEYMSRYFSEMEQRVQANVLKELALEKEAEKTRVWVNKGELAKYLRVSFRTLDKFMKANPSFPSSDIAGAVRYNVNRVDEWMEVHDAVVKQRRGKGYQGD